MGRPRTFGGPLRGMGVVVVIQEPSAVAGDGQRLVRRFRQRVFDASGAHVRDVDVLPRGGTPQTTIAKLQRARLHEDHAPGQPHTTSSLLNGRGRSTS
jgi:hypothetical protein